MDYTIPNINIEHFSKVKPYNGDFSTLFIYFSKEIDFSTSIIINKFSQFLAIKEIKNEPFLKRAVEVFFRNGGNRLYLFLYKVKEIGFRLTEFTKKLTRECDRLNDIEVIVAINLYSKEIYNEIFSINRIIRIQRTINEYCQSSHKISITDINQDFKDDYFDLITNTIICYPWIIDKNNKITPPSIYLSALFSKMAKENRYFESIANKSLYNAKDVQFRFNRDKLSSLTKKRINPVIFMPHRGVMFWGVKTFGEKQDTINELRVMKFIKRRLVKISQIYIFEPNSFTLELQIITVIKSFLEELEKIGAIETFIVESATDKLDREYGQITINIKIAFFTPIEFINIRLTKLDREGMEPIITI